MPRKSTGGASAPGTPAAKSGRKSLNGSTPSGDAEASTSTSGGSGLVVPPGAKLALKQQEVALKGIDNFELPRTNVIKVAKSDIPDTVQLRKEVQQALVKSASVFISYLTATAHERATAKGGKIISAQHVLDAIREIELDEGDAEVTRELKEHLRAYRDNVARKKTEKASASSTKTSAATAAGEAGEEAEDADVSRFDAGEAEDADESVLPAGEDDDAGDASLLRKSLHGGGAHADDEDEEGEGEDQLMDED